VIQYTKILVGEFNGGIKGACAFFLFHLPLWVYMFRTSQTDYLWNEGDAYAEKRTTSTKGEVCPKRD